jgi:hypothetical protein
MKVTKSLLLGAAAGLVAMSGAQAADLPVKAKPVEYVKICSAYGAGFYYIPGTDICLRVGGYVFAEFGVKAAAANASIYTAASGAAGTISRNSNYWNWRSRGHVIMDARNNTAYGTLRAYFAVGVSNTNGVVINQAAGNSTTAGGNTGAASIDRAFIEFAGFTFGYTESFFSYFGGSWTILSIASTSWQWLNTAAYTAQLGNGVTASVAIEDNSHRTSLAVNATTGAVAGYTGAGIINGTGYGGAWSPDIVANLKVVQAWGSAQVSAATNQIKTNNLVLQANPGADTTWGYSFLGGFSVKTPQTGNANNEFGLEGIWTKGNVERTGISGGPGTAASGVGVLNQGIPNAGPVGAIFDAIPGLGGGSLQLTKAWSVNGRYRHYWTPMLRTVFAAGYTDVNVPSNAATNGYPDFNLWQGVVSTIWSPSSGFDLSLDIMYTDIETDACNAAVAALRCNQSKSIWTAWTRIRRNF